LAVTLEELARLVGGRVIGDPATEVSGVCPADEAQKGRIAFATGPEFVEKLRGSDASAVFVPEPIDDLEIAQVVVEDPRRAFFQAAALFKEQSAPAPGISDRAFVDPTASLGAEVTVFPLAYVGAEAAIGDRVRIYPGAYVGRGVRIGDDSTLFANVSVGEGTLIGRRVTLHFGASVGADGFGYLQEGDVHVKIPQTGGVVIEDDVEIGSNTTVDRATLGNTVIGAGTKIDNLVQVAHNCKVGRNVILVAHSGLAGSTVLGDNVLLAARSGTKDHVTVGERSIIGGMSGVRKDLPPGSKVIGYPAEDHMLWKRQRVFLAKSGELVKKVRDLEARIAELEKRLGKDD